MHVIEMYLKRGELHQFPIKSDEKLDMTLKSLEKIPQ